MQVAIWAKQGNFEAARIAMEMYARENPGEESVVILMGDIELAAGNLSAAARQYEVAAERAWNRDIALRLARAYQQVQPEREVLVGEKVRAGGRAKLMFGSIRRANDDDIASIATWLSQIDRTPERRTQEEGSRSLPASRHEWRRNSDRG